ncbi:hypothetical protein PAMA_021357 [Pampus argenteus]
MAMGVYLLILSCLGLSITAQAQNCTKPTGGTNNTVLKDSDIRTETFPSGATATFVCDTGYMKKGGSGVTTCTAGQWSTVTLECQRKNCGSGGHLDNGDIDYPEGTEFGDKMVITCNSGYNLVGKSEIICGDGKWSDRLPRCEVITCHTQPKLENGSVETLKDTYVYREVVYFKCNTGFTLKGPQSIYCSENGQFNANPPTCIKVNCEDPVIANGVWVSGSRPPHGYLATVTYMCDNRFEMKGEPTLKCEINGQWSPELPICTGNKGHKLSTAWIVVICVIVVIGVIIIIIICFRRWKQRRGTRKGHSDKEAAKDGEGLALSQA